MGPLKDTMAADLLVHTFKNLISRSKIDPKVVEDIAVGCVLAPGGGATEYRAAALAAGFPEAAAVKSLNRQCSSGLQACVDMAKEYKISRADQDAFAAASYQKALKAQQSGLFDEEIAPITVKYTDPKTDEEKTVTVSKDDGTRPGITA